MLIMLMVSEGYAQRDSLKNRQPQIWITYGLGTELNSGFVNGYKYRIGSMEKITIKIKNGKFIGAGSYALTHMYDNNYYRVYIKDLAISGKVGIALNRGSFTYTILSGVSYLKRTEEQYDYEYDYVLNKNIEIVNTTAVNSFGVPIEMGFMWSHFRWIGFGFQGYYNWNTIEPLYGILFTTHLGLLPYFPKVRR